MNCHYFEFEELHIPEAISLFLHCLKACLKISLQLAPAF